jgi:cob(I)alamin adenosyltransferase
MDEAEQHKQRAQKHKEAFEKKLASAQKEKGLLIVNTGTGKGKTTAAMGMGIRVLGHGMKLGIVQFIKGAIDSAERNFLGSHPLCTFKTIGEGYTWNVQDLDRDKTTARKGWEEAATMIRSNEYKMVILDELNVVLKYNYLPLEEVLSVLAERADDVHVVITGRNAPEQLVAAADLVSEMKPIKHPYREQGIKAQQGVEF